MLVRWDTAMLVWRANTAVLKGFTNRRKLLFSLVSNISVAKHPVNGWRVQSSQHVNSFLQYHPLLPLGKEAQCYPKQILREHRCRRWCQLKCCPTPSPQNPKVLCLHKSCILWITAITATSHWKCVPLMWMDLSKEFSFSQIVIYTWLCITSKRGFAF